MRRSRRLRWLLVLFLLYLSVCTVGGIYLADGTLRPARRTLTDEDTATFKSTVHAMRGELQDVSITTADQVILRGWLLRVRRETGTRPSFFMDWRATVWG
jgi:hypothetical protein